MTFEEFVVESHREFDSRLYDGPNKWRLGQSYMNVLRTTAGRQDIYELVTGTIMDVWNVNMMDSQESTDRWDLFINFVKENW